jgi:hypothetical protein
MEGQLKLRSKLFEEIRQKDKDKFLISTLTPIRKHLAVKNYSIQQKMSKLIRTHKELPDAIKEQIKYLNEKFPAHPMIDRKARHLARQEEIDIKIARDLAIYEFFDTRDFFHSRFFDGIFAAEPDGRRVYLTKKLTKKKIERVCLFQGALISKKGAKPVPVIVKWYESERKDTEYEISAYCELRKINCKTPWFSSSFMLWKTPVLVMEPLEELDHTDDEYEAAAQTLQELKIIHQKGIHNDIKRQNVMKRKYKPDPTGKRVDKGEWEYLVIDYGGMTVERLGYGWKRSVWSPKYTCQKPHPKKPQITTPWHDFKETGYMMKDIQNLRTSVKMEKDSKKTHKSAHADKLPIREGFEGKLKAYMDYLHDEVDKKNVQPEDYDNLIAICRTGKPLRDSSQKKKIISPPLKNVPQETIYAASEMRKP